MGGYVVRAVVFDYSPVSVYKASRAAGLAAYLGGSTGGATVELHVVRVARVGLLVQEPPANSVSIVWQPTLRIEGFDGTLCRYHEGPRGQPERHWYCSRPAVTRDGYCSVHARSWKALYERCAQGVESACLEASRLLRGEKFAVYVLDYGGGRAKVGMTQEWRLMWRIAEQPHVAVAHVYTGELLEARETERRLGRHRLATEGAAVRLQERLRVAAATLVRLREGEGFGRAASRLAELLSSLGMGGSYRAYTILPKDIGWITSARVVASLEPLTGRTLRILDYWAGLLYVEADGERFAVDKRALLHRLLRGSIG